MLVHRLLARHLIASVASCAWLLPSVALAASKDKSASALADDAMQTDYVGTQFKTAEKKLKKSLTQCGASACSRELVARLHRDLATVYIAGLKQNAKGKTELKRALQIDPDLQLDDDLATSELRQAFKSLGGHERKPAEEEREAPAATPKKEAPCEPGSDGCDTETTLPEPESVTEAPSKFPRNWLSLHFEQDFLIYSGQNNVCASVGQHADAPNYSCFQSGSQFGYSAGQEIPAGPGNHIAGGVGRATPRILLGFDHLLSANVSFGLRVGFAFAGSPAPRTGPKFVPFHAELRFNYWFGADPFQSAGLRPYLSLSGGLAEMDGHVLVEYYDAQGRKGTLDAWRKTGKGFAGLGLGMMIPIGRSGIVPEVRGVQLFGNSGTAFDVSLGYAYGF